MTFTQDVDWDVGDEIVIASSNFDFLEAEQRTIVAVSWRMITLDRPLLHHHHGALGPETLGQFTAEVLPVSRCKSLRVGLVGLSGCEMSSRRCFATPDQSLYQDCSSYRELHARRESLGVVHRSRTIFCRPVAKTNGGVSVHLQ